MSDAHLHLSSHTLRSTTRAWWYEEAAGICVVQEYWDRHDRYIGMTSVMIPWRAIRQALARKEKP